MGTPIVLVDTTLRDGMSSVSHQFTAEQVGALAAGLARGGVPLVEVAHGVGLGASSIQFGVAAATDREYVRAAATAVAGTPTDVAVLYVPGISTLGDLDAARRAGAGTVRVATHCTEADCAEQPIRHARAAGMRVMSFLMLSHRLVPDALAEQARKLESYGTQVVYVVDSAGAMVPREAATRVRALRRAVGVEIGFHAHNNLGLGVGNALAAADEGATHIDGSLRGLGAGAGNAQTEVLSAALYRAGYDPRTDTFALTDLAERTLAPLQREPQIVDEAALLLGWAGLYSTYFYPAKRAARKFGVPLRDLLLELGRRNLVGGQEDMIIDVAAELAR